MAYNQQQPGDRGYGPEVGGYSDQEQSVPRPLRSSSSNSSSTVGDEHPQQQHSPYNHSNPSLPRYTSQQQLAHPSPLNPAAPRQGQQPYSHYAQPQSSNASSRLSQYGHPGNHNTAHPLSHAMYADSSPTLAGSVSPSEEKMRLGAADQLGEYIAPQQLSASTTNRTGGQAYRRGPLKATGLTALYRGWSGANLADSGKDERHIKLPRLGYLDGVKFVAAWVVLNATFFDAVIEDNDYAFIQRNSPLYITRYAPTSRLIAYSLADL